jgi:hypothetical protein
MACIQGLNTYGYFWLHALKPVTYTKERYNMPIDNGPSAKIIGQNHEIIPYLVNGKKRYVIEDIPVTRHRRVVNIAVQAVGRRWEDVYNFIDTRLVLPMDKRLETAINSMTY